jgi:UDP-glucose 4-epimerase
MFVILGGSGFIGTNLRTRLAELKIPFNVVSRNPAALLKIPTAHEGIVSLTEFEGSEGAKLIQEASVILYLTSASVPSTFAEEPWRDIEANVILAARTFWRIARLNPLAKIVFLSSGGTIYGDQPTQPTSEQAPTAPKSGYGIGKLLIEEALRFTGRVTGIPYAILRVSNPIGPYQTNNAQGIVTLAVRAAIDGGTIRLFDEGRQVRDYVHVRDVVESILAAYKTEISQGTWNIGSGTGVATAEILKMIESVTGREVRIEFYPKRPLDVSYIVLDISRAGVDLKWSPAHPIRSAVEDVYRSLMPMKPIGISQGSESLEGAMWANKS